MILSLPTPALAAGPYDDTWQVDAGPAGNPGTNTTGNPQCEAQQLHFQVNDNQIQGPPARSPYGGNRVTEGGGPAGVCGQKARPGPRPSDRRPILIQTLADGWG